MRTFDAKVKMWVVREYLAGKGGNKLLAARFNIAESMARRWVFAHRHHGIAGLDRQRGSFSREFKLEVLHRAVTENLTFRQLAAIYNIANPHSITMWKTQQVRGKLQLPSLKRLPKQEGPLPAKRTSRQLSKALPSEESDALIRENQR